MLKKKRVALMAGMSYNQHADFRQLRGTQNDLLHFHAFLSLAGFDRIEADFDPDASKVLSKWRALVSPLNPGDLALFAFFGHSLTYADDLYFLASDSRRATLPTEADAFSFRTLKRMSDKCGAERVFFLDCCRSRFPARADDSRGKPASAGEYFQACTDIRAIAAKQSIDIAAMFRASQHAPGPVTTVCSCQTGEVALEIPQLRRGLLTTAFLKAAQRRLDSGTPIRLDDDFMTDCRSIVQRLVAENRLATGAIPDRVGGEHGPLLADGKASSGVKTPLGIAFPADHQVQTATSNELAGVAPQCGTLPDPTPARVLTNSYGMQLVYIRPGTFMMGSPEHEPRRGQDEVLHQVTLARGFFLGATLVTQAQWTRVMGYNPSRFHGDENCPVERVSWEAAIKFLAMLSEIDGRSYRLPTEAEWEYACRAGTTTRFNTGVDITTAQANFHGDYPRTGGPHAKYSPHTTAVTSYPPNPWGLYDMHGNVWEWCADWYGKLGVEAVTDPIGPAVGTARVFRGGSCYHRTTSLRSASRGNAAPYLFGGYVGFRVALDAD